MKVMYRWQAGFSLLLCIPALLLSSCTSKGTSRNAPSAEEVGEEKAVPVKVAEISRRDVQRIVAVVGTLMANEEVTVSAEIDGRVDKVLVDIGDQVRKGQTLLVVSPEELQFTLNGKVAQLRQALAKLGVTDEGGAIPPDARVPDVQKAAADRNVAEQDFKRARDLFAQSLIPRQQLDAAESKFISARATYDSTLQQVQITKASIDQQRAEVDLARKKLSDSQIKAPFAGWIKDRQVTPGQYLKVQAPVFTIVDVNPLRFTAEVPDRIAPWIKTGDALELRVEAYPERTFGGKITRIGPSSSQASRTFTIEALIENNQNLLKPGFFAKANISVDKHDSILLAPSGAVSFAYGVYKLYAIQNGKISLDDVKVGDRFDDEVELIDGGREHLQVAASNLARLRDGTPVVPDTGDDRTQSKAGGKGDASVASTGSGKPAGVFKNGKK